MDELIATFQAYYKDALGRSFVFFRRFTRSRIIEMAYELLVFSAKASLMERQLEIQGKRVLIVGSAPSATLNGLTDFDFVIGVHGSPANIRSSLGLKTDLVVVDRSLFNAEQLETNRGKGIIAERDMLRGNPLLKMVVTQSNSIQADTPIEEVADINMAWHLSRMERRIILRRATRSLVLDSWDYRSLTGTGGFAIALAQFFGAASIKFTGFNLVNRTQSLWPSHFYAGLYGENLEDQDPLIPGAFAAPRTHSSADAVVVASLSLRGFDISTNESDFFPLIQNWLRPAG